MIYVEYENRNGKCVVTFIHYFPFDEVHGLGKTKEELEQSGLFVDEIPDPEENGKIPQLLVNPDTKELWYEYLERPLTLEEKLQLIEQENSELKQRIEIIQQALDELILGGV